MKLHYHCTSLEMLGRYPKENVARGSKYVRKVSGDWERTARSEEVNEVQFSFNVICSQVSARVLVPVVGLGAWPGYRG